MVNVKLLIFQGGHDKALSCHRDKALSCHRGIYIKEKSDARYEKRSIISKNLATESKTVAKVKQKI